MKKVSRILIVVISLTLVLAYVLPMWKINLEAPQYPEGLGMKIWINKLSGDVNTINGLNHYIGMQTIHEDSIPELKYMPYILAFIIGLGLLTALVGKKYLLYTWVILLCCMGLAAGIDFYIWEYEYGHNLDPRAPIKVPGMNYQPPLWGSKQLLNFTAHSFPDWGGYIVIAVSLIGVLIMVYCLMNSKNNTGQVYSGNYNDSSYMKWSAIIVVLLIVSCKVQPEPIEYGKEACVHCKMKIVDSRFGAELVSKTGKIYKFDAVECMVDHLNEMSDDKRKVIQYTLVKDATDSGGLVEVDVAYFLHSKNLPSPMGANLTAFKDIKIAKEFQQEYEGDIIQWPSIANILAQRK